MGGAVTYDLTINLAADAKPGYSRDELDLITNDPNPRAARVPVPIETFVMAPVSVHPSPLIMGTAEAGKLTVRVMRPLVVRSQSPFRITSVESSDPHFECEVPTTVATIQRLPRQFPWRRDAGQDEHQAADPHDSRGRADRGRCEH